MPVYLRVVYQSTTEISKLTLVQSGNSVPANMGHSQYSSTTVHVSEACIGVPQ